MCAGPNPLFAMHCGAKGRKGRCSSQVIINKWIKKRSRRDGSYRGHIRGGFIWRTLRNSSATCMMILHNAQLVRRAGEDAEGNYDAAKREYEIVLKLQSGNTPAKGSLRKLGLKVVERR
jgi:hypothetical protein